MKKNAFKRALAGVLAGAMVMGGIYIPEITVSAAHQWSALVSESGYPKVPYTEMTVKADSEQRSGEEPSGTGKHGFDDNMIDGDPVSYWHTNWGNVEDDNPKPTTAMDVNNTFTLTMNSPQNVTGVTYLPRQDTMGNGVILQFHVDVQADGSEEWTRVYDQTTDLYSNPDGNWVGDEKAEKEFIFEQTHENIKKVRFTVTKTGGSEGTPNSHINAAEVGVLMAQEAVAAPELSITSPAAGEAPQPGSIDGYWEGESGVSFAGRNGDTLTTSNVSGTGFSVDEGHDAFHGRWQIDSAQDKFNITGNTPFVISFWMKRDASAANGTAYSIIGKMNEQYGVQMVPGANGQDIVQMYCKISGNGWPTYKSATADLTQWTQVKALYDGYKFWFSLGEGSFDYVKHQGADSFELVSSDVSKFTIGYNHGENSSRTYPGLLADMKMYRMDEATTAGTCADATAAAALVSQLEATEPILTSAVNYHTPYTAAYQWTDADGAEVSTFAEGVSYTMTATLTAETHYYFAEESKPAMITIDGIGVTLEEGDVVISEDGSTMTITHTFSPDQLSVMPGYTEGCDSSMGSLTATSVSEDGSATVTAEPAEGYEFVGWYSTQDGSGDALSTDASYTISGITESQNIYARFQLKQLSVNAEAMEGGTVSITSGGQTVQSGSTVGYGSKVTFTAAITDTAAYKFTGWQNAEGTIVSTDVAYTISSLTADISLTAVFAAYNLDAETDFWDQQKALGTLASQADTDIWHYQIQTANGWEDILGNVFYSNMANGSGAWLGNGSRTSYHWAKIEKDTLTPCFDGNATYKGVAYAWKASEAGYVKMILAKNLNTNSNKAAMTVTIAKGTDSADQEVLKEVSVASGSQNIDKGQFTSKIAKVNVGDYVRLSVATADNDLYNVEPIVVKVTVSEYAAQYLAEVENKETGSYTNASAQAYTDAVNALRTALEASEADEAIETKLATLETAVAGLAVKANYDAVNTAVADANAKIQSGSYTPASVEVLQSVLDTAASQMDLDETHQTEVDAMAAAINAAIANLVQKADKAGLESKITEVQGIIAGEDYANYTDASKTELESKLAAAQKAYADENATQDAVDAAKTDLEDAMTGLALKDADYKAVTDALATAEAVARDSYTPDSLKVLDAAVTAAKESVANKLDITQQETVNGLATAITDAISKLVEKAKTEELAAAIAEAEAKKAEDGYENNYTDESKTVLDSKLQTAKGVLADGNATQDAVDAAKTDLEDAMTSLTLKDADYTVVTDALAAAEKVERNLYTPDSLTVLDAAVTAAEESIANKLDITQQETVNGLATAITDAISKLVEKAKTEELAAAITAAEAKKAEDGYENNYTDESKTVLDSKLQTAKDVLADGNATQDAVDAAKTELEGAVTGLDLKDADYTAVDKAKAAAAAIVRDNYTDESLAVLDAAVAAVMEGMDVTQQGAVDQMAKDIKDAIAALERHYTVTVVGGTIKEDRKYKYGEMASVTANDPEEGMKFAYWKVDGQYMCDSSTYNFYVTNDMQVEAYYMKVEEKVEQQISMTCVSSYNASTRKITFTARRSLPEGYQVLEHGIIITDSTGYNNFKGNVDSAFVVGANRIKTAKGTTTGVLGNYSAKLSCSRNETWYGRGYVKYKAPDGTVDYAYSPVTSCAATVE